MSTIINATTTNGVVIEPDNSGSLELQTNSGTTAVTIDTSQRAAFVAGTAALPAITTTGDTNTGMFFPAADTIAFAESGTEAMRLNSVGYVGIGTTSPQSFLDINAGSSGVPTYTGTIRIGSHPAQSLASTGGLEFLATSYSSGYGWRLCGIDLGGGSVPFVFQTRQNSATWTEAMRIDQNSAVWIGGSTTAGGPVVLGKGGAAGGSVMTFYKPNSGATNVILNYYGATYVGGINMDNTSTSFPTSSDIRLKKDIVDAPSATQKIDSIRIVSHGWKHDEAVVDFGIIAQELYEIIPRAVTKGDDNEEVETVWSVDYSKLVPMLIKAHQEQQTIINDLKARIETLEIN